MKVNVSVMAVVMVVAVVVTDDGGHRNGEDEGEGERFF